MSPRQLDFERALNPEQKAAVTHEGGPQLVLAGAGSGKTRVITWRIAWLVQERRVDPSTITAVTFTNKAAAEMKGRVEELLGLHPLPAFVGTFHRFALRLLRIYGERVDLPKNFAIFDSSDQLALVKKAISAEGLSEKNFTPRAVLGRISGAKNRLLDPAGFEKEHDDFMSRRVAPVYRRYQALLREAGGVDFDDMIRLAVKLLDRDESLARRIRRRTQHLLVDEFQDTNHAQLRLVQGLSSGHLTAVGDEDQSIYRWRGAELSNILEFERFFPGAVAHKLERNYRSTQNILDASGALVENNTGRRGKRLWTEAGAGETLTFYRARDDQDEARFIATSVQGLERQGVPLFEVAVLVRTNAQTRVIEEEFLRRRIPYALIGGMRFYERAEVKDLVAYLRLVRNPRDLYSLNRVINKPPRGIGAATQQALHKRAEERGKTAWDVLVDDDLARFPVRTANALLRFRDLLQGLLDEAEDLRLPELLRRVIEVTGYNDLYSTDEPEGRAKLENVGELVSAAQEFIEAHGYGSDEEDLLTAFLDHAALTSEADASAGERVSLMTLHSAKGLEFEAVILPGLEEDVLPHFNAGTLDEEVEEERRLLYVGMTRAKARLLLAASQRRRRGGLYQDQKESRFLGEIPRALLSFEVSPELARLQGGGSVGSAGSAADNVAAFFGRDTGNGGGASAPSPFPASSVSTAARRRHEDAESEFAVKRGDRVRHETLGVGKLLQIEGTGKNAKFVVYFDGVGRRKLVARYAQLEVL